MPDFEAVIAATVQKETLIQEANGYRVNTLPAAESKARATIENARVRQNEALAKARMDIAAFDGLYVQYAQKPGMVTDGVFLSRIGALLAKMQVVISGSDTGPRMLLP
jgi:regulator of protease activity HflC (stomatin/prohibitin superfamily)